MKDRKKQSFKFFLFVIVLCFVAFGVGMLVRDENNVLSDLLDSFGDSSFKDNYNGVYTYAEDLNGTKTLFKGCILSKINNHIVIINDRYYVYRSSCVGTFLLSEGKTKELDINTNEERKSYYIKYNDLVYYKDYTVTSLEVGNNFKTYNDKISLSDYQLLFRESQYPGNYFNVDPKRVDGLSTEINVEFKYIKNEEFTIKLYNRNGDTLYTYTFKDFNSMPEFYPYGAYLVIIEKDENDTKYNNNLKVVGEDGVVYNLNDKFPIIVDDVTLDRNKSIYVSFDKKNMYFRVIISDDKEMCYENSTDTSISYYEFMVDYNYSSKSFEKPEFVKRGFKNDSCVYINDILGG